MNGYPGLLYEKPVEIVESGERLEILSCEDFVLEPAYFYLGYTTDFRITLRTGVIDRLRKAQSSMQCIPSLRGCKFKIWDGFRTLEVQRKLYEMYFDQLKATHPDWSDGRLHEAVKVFVFPPSDDPSLPSWHNTGGAIDLTIVNPSGVELDMGTAFDEFTERAFTNHFIDAFGTDKERIHWNRMQLRTILETAGFYNYPNEWWHFSHGDQAWAAANGKNAIYGSAEL